ncbi:ABC transporter ATP-binding protein [Bartonella sp. HY329]|uniref:ABC transporter ATP-binding protein n=1 Tax=unclassified Bartonella TaxID=2645622 RepID=UPI0021C8E458|nr:MULTISPECIES: ABC transporter ATP-binding protein [unclassified Bartonella]UXM95082.1 ABC transporter ATP-binding protein [Bartonella sp. HY329]UXN09405.1 ABC transporter ATP-binding protein [Bartonella sp. HY328]
MLTISHLEAAYGASKVLFDVNLSIKQGEIITLLGRNGMGKTTTVKTLMGLLDPKGGNIEFNKRDITGALPEHIARLGLGLVPEGRETFSTLTVYENLVATAANRKKKSSPWTLARIYKLFPRLEERAKQLAGTLSGGEQQMLVISRALMTNPDLLILDEATEGLAPVIRAEIWNCIDILKQEGLSIIIIDKNIGALKRLANRHFILERGKTVWSGTTQDLQADEERLLQIIGI